MSPVPNYTPWWRETKWSKVPCLRAMGEAYTPGLQIWSSRCWPLDHTPPPTSRWFIVLQQTWPCSIITESTTSCPTYNTKKNLLIFFPAWQWKLTSRYLWVCSHGFPYISFAASSSQKFLPSHFSFTMSVDLEKLIEKSGRKSLN